VTVAAHVVIRADHTSKTTVQYRQSPQAGGRRLMPWTRVDPPQSVSFYQPHFDTLYRAYEAVMCQGAARGGRRSPACRQLIRPDVLRGQGAVIRIRIWGRRAVKARSLQ